MPYPAGVVTRPVSFGGAFATETGDPVEMRVTIRASRSMVWMPTGSPVVALGADFIATDGSETTINLPVTDQEGWGDGTGGSIPVGGPNNYHSHSYTATVGYYKNGIERNRTTIGPFVLPQGDGSTVDMDNLVVTPNSEGESVFIPAGGTPGADGQDGQDATITVGNVVTRGPGEPADVENVGTPSAAIFDFYLPTGPQGAVGTPGPPGPAGITLTARAVSPTYVLNAFAGTDHTVTLASNISLAVENLTNGASIYLALIQDGVGGRVVTIPSSWLGREDVTLATAANNYDILIIWRSPLGIHIKHIDTGVMPSSFWTPDNLPNQVSWYDGNGIAGESAASVSTWLNRWTETNLATSGSSAPPLRVLNGVKYLELDGVGRQMFTDYNGTFGSQALHAGVFRWNGSPTGGPVLSGLGASGIALYINNAGNWEYRYRSDASHAAGGAANGQWQTIVAGVAESGVGGDPGYIRVNGVQVNGPAIDATGARNGNALRVGAAHDGSAYGEVDVAELIQLSVPQLTTQQMADLENYLNAKRDTLNGV